MSKTVVAGYDDSAESAAAVRWAAAEAARFGAPLQVVHVWGFAGETHGGAGTSRLGEQVLAAVQGVADAGADIARDAAPGVEVSAVVSHGPVAEVLVDLSRDALLVVVGRRGSGRVAGGLLGSVAHAVLHLAHCPVVVVAAGDAGSTPGVGSDEVVVGFDGSAGAYQALDAAAAAARVRGGGVRVLTAWSPASETRSMTYWAVAYPDESPGEVALERAERAQAEARAWWEKQHADVPVEWELPVGVPVDALVKASVDAGLVVVGARGRGGLASLLLGSVSRAVVHGAHGPVEVTRSEPAPS
ncbi:universal stress protein [Cellulomonas sp. WB94]|uniref:universal stress protein n=1 Tax=Cellulomonas sp. WB94 TaxID=2173174 RepID=UPI001304B43B|nr:universal stress protein [Cellulomonas sp. WB94]